MDPDTSMQGIYDGECKGSSGTKTLQESFLFSFLPEALTGASGTLEYIVSISTSGFSKIWILTIFHTSLDEGYLELKLDGDGKAINL